MPTPSEILQAASALAQAWQPLSVLWHVVFLAFAASLGSKWRPATRCAALMLAAPLLSVVVMAWSSGNPFTTVVLGTVLVGLTIIGWRLPKEPPSFAVGPLLSAGMVMVLFGLVYPHFLGPVPFITYLYAAPVGIVPCPTLSVVIGFSIILSSLSSRGWGLLLGAAGLFYGAFGALRLGVALDWVLFLGAVVLVFTAWRRASPDDTAGASS